MGTYAKNIRVFKKCGDWDHAPGTVLYEFREGSKLSALQRLGYSSTPIYNIGAKSSGLVPHVTVLRSGDGPPHPLFEYAILLTMGDDQHVVFCDEAPAMFEFLQVISPLINTTLAHEAK